MKKIITVGLFIMGISGAQAQNTISPVNLENTEIFNLQVDQSELMVNVPYPMENISGVCFLDIVADSYGRQISVEKLLDQVEILTAFGGPKEATFQVISGTVIRVFLTPSYVDGITLKAKNGKTLKEAVGATLGANRQTVLMPRSCK